MGLGSPQRCQGWGAAPAPLACRFASAPPSGWADSTHRDARSPRAVLDPQVPVASPVVSPGNHHPLCQRRAQLGIPRGQQTPIPARICPSLLPCGWAVNLGGMASAGPGLAHRCDRAGPRRLARTWPWPFACGCARRCRRPAALRHPRLSLSAAVLHVSGLPGRLTPFFSFNLEMQFPPQNTLFPVNNISLVRLQQKSLSCWVLGALSPGEPHPSRLRVCSRRPALAAG